MCASFALTETRKMTLNIHAFSTALSWAAVFAAAGFVVVLAILF